MIESYKCEFCDKFFKSKPALNSHIGKCKLNPNATNKIPTEKQKEAWKSNKGKFYIKKKNNCYCQFCNRKFNYGFALTNHLKTCRLNPNRDEEHSKKLSEIQKKAVTKEMREKASKRTVFNNFWKYRSKNPILYESIKAGKMKLDSKWELIVAKRLDELGVEWYRPRIRLPYFDLEGVEHSYYPDFYVKTYNCFIEVKSEFIKKYQNSSSNKVDYIKTHYKFVKWIETEDECRTFQLNNLNCEITPEKDEEDIEFWLTRKNKTKKIIKKETINKREENIKNLEKERWEIIEKSEIDFSEFGWVKQLSKLWHIASNKAGKYVRKHYPDFYKEKCFIRK